MAATLSDFRSRFPEFSTTADDVVNVVLGDSALFLSAPAIGQLYAAAHLLAIAAQENAVADGGAGVVTDEVLGPLRRTYMTMAGNEREAFWATSAYGRRYLTIRNSSTTWGISAMVV